MLNVESFWNHTHYYGKKTSAHIGHRIGLWKAIRYNVNIARKLNLNAIQNFTSELNLKFRFELKMCSQNLIPEMNFDLKFHFKLKFYIEPGF